MQTRSSAHPRQQGRMLRSALTPLAAAAAALAGKPAAVLPPLFTEFGAKSLPNPLQHLQVASRPTGTAVLGSLPSVAIPSVASKSLPKPWALLKPRPTQKGSEEPSAAPLAALEHKSLPSTATASGFAFNGGKVSAHATSTARSNSAVQAVSEAVALANRASAARTKATADASNVGQTGAGLAKSQAAAVADQSSLAVAKAGSKSIGLGDGVSNAVISSNSAATDNAASIVGGTAVAISGPDSNAGTTSTATGTAEKKSLGFTRSDSISIGYKDSDAVGSATATSQASNHGTAISQSQMESFAIDKTNSTASSVANATAADGGIGIIRDKAATLGFSGSAVSSNTASQGHSAVLGFTLVDSVARAITANNQHVCAKAVTKTYSDLPSGSQVSLDTFLLALKQRADQRCVSSFKDLATKNSDLGKFTSKSASDDNTKGALPTFESIRSAVLASTSGLTHAAEKAVGKVNEFVHSELTDVPQAVSSVTLDRGSW